MSLLRKLPFLDRVRGAMRHDVEQSLKPLRKEVRQLLRRVDELEVALRDASLRAARGDRDARQVKTALQLNASQASRLRELDAVLEPDRIDRHVRRAVAAAPMVTSPFHHVVVNELLPADVYALLIESIPPEVFFTERDPIKQDLVVPMEFGSDIQLRVWTFVDQVLAKRIIRPAVMEKFHEPLQQHYDVVFGAAARERANRLPFSTSGGRLMLRRPGYHLNAHRDPKRSLLTCLLYLAREGDNEAYGTQLYRVEPDSEAHYKQTYYPEREGHTCQLERVVPFRANSMLVFLNSRGAHGADIPADAPAATERYSYQFYVAPDNAALAELLKSLPPDRRAMWQNRERVVPAGT